jgi:hypothetical protein
MWAYCFLLALPSGGIRCFVLFSFRRFRRVNERMFPRPQALPDAAVIAPLVCNALTMLLIFLRFLPSSRIVNSDNPCSSSRLGAQKKQSCPSGWLPNILVPWFYMFRAFALKSIRI